MNNEHFFNDYGYDSQDVGYESRDSQLEAQGVDTDIDLTFGKGYAPSSTNPGGNCDTTGMERIARLFAVVNRAIPSEDGIDITYQQNIDSITKTYSAYDAGSGNMIGTWGVDIVLDPKFTKLRYKASGESAQEVTLIPTSDSPYSLSLVLYTGMVG